MKGVKNVYPVLWMECDLVNTLNAFDAPAKYKMKALRNVMKKLKQKR